jgi:hypothetical protein
MNEPSKEAMEKANEILSRTGKNPFGIASKSELVNAFAIEFTKYQKRIEELEEIVKEAARLSTARSDMKPEHQMKVLRDKARSHLAKGVKEEG